MNICQQILLKINACQLHFMKKSLRAINIAHQYSANWNERNQL